MFYNKWKSLLYQLAISKMEPIYLIEIFAYLYEIQSELNRRTYMYSFRRQFMESADIIHIRLPLQDTALTWETEDPDFTSCFLQTALVWAPCILLFLFAPLDIYYAIVSKYRNIPWGYLNVFRLMTTGALIIVTLVDIIMAATWSTDEIFDVHIVTPVVKIVTFVSIITCEL